VHKLHVGPLIAKMKLATIVGVLAALAVANAGSVDIKLQGKAIAITPTEDAWQQLVAPLSEVAFLTPAKLAKLVNVTDQCDKECRAACCKDGGGCETNSYLRATCDAKCGCPLPLPPDTYKCGTGKVVAEVVTHNHDLNKVEMDYCYPPLQGPGKSICKTCTILYQASSTDPYEGPYITTLQIAEEVDQLLYWDVTDSSRTKTVSRALAPWPTRLDVEFDDASDSYKCINKQCVKAPGGITKESCLRICG